MPTLTEVMSLFSVEQLELIRRLHASGVTLPMIALAYQSEANFKHKTFPIHFRSHFDGKYFTFSYGFYLSFSVRWSHPVDPTATP